MDTDRSYQNAEDCAPRKLRLGKIDETIPFPPATARQSREQNKKTSLNRMREVAP